MSQLIYALPFSDSLKLLITSFNKKVYCIDNNYAMVICDIIYDF